MKKLGIFGLLCFSASLLFAGHTVVPANEKLKINTNDIVGATHSEPKTEKMYKIVCKGE